MEQGEMMDSFDHAVAPVTAALLAGGVGVLLLAAGIAKLRDRDTFLGTLAAYRLVPDPLLGPAAWALGAVETVLGTMLLGGVSVRAAGYGAALLFVLFALSMAVNVMRGRTDLSCGCLPGLASARLSWGAVARTLLLAPPALLPGLAGLPAAALLRYQSLAAGACLLALGLAASHLLPAGAEEPSA
ncbi:putative methylamine utilization protein mauE [Gluconacetobacter diazotrophicus PA1 5]|uniref:Methylamine utilization protein MauE n=2 Tax=Gluconacetobacter diazotrophicus TaxID=33996 RepID=A9H2Z0_GLUDA|nr:putative methylamine utilization protein mauE [Gluconacetobacter diazotrophicus PA1 5]